MSGNRFRNNKRFLRPPNGNSQWQNDKSRSSDFSFGYRRHELKEDSSVDSYRDETLIHTAVPYGHVSSDATVSVDSQYERQNNATLRSVRSDGQACLSPVNANYNDRRNFQLSDELSESVKASFDTDFRIHPAAPAAPRENWSSQNKNPYWNVGKESQVSNMPRPILKNARPANPWMQRPTAPSRVQYGTTSNSENHNDNLFIHQQPGMSRGLATQNSFGDNTHGPSGTYFEGGGAEGYSPERYSAEQEGLLQQEWHPLPGTSDTRKSFFENIKQEEDYRNMFGRSDAFLKSCHQPEPAKNMGSNFSAAFSNINEDEPSFSMFSAKGGTVNLHSEGNQEACKNSTFQGTWRSRSQPGRDRSFLGGNAEESQEPAAVGVTQVQGRHQMQKDSHSFVPPRKQQQWQGRSQQRKGTHNHEPRRFQGQPQIWQQEDARAVLERKRRCATEEPLSPCGSAQPDQAKAANTPVQASPPPGKLLRGVRQEKSTLLQTEGPNHNTRLWVENHFPENDFPKSTGSEVHEVDESRLLPSDVHIEALKHVVFVNIDKRSFFEEVKEAFLPGTLLYLFYGDPTILLPTREHPFYKENRNNWIHFYPDCGTEYGSYLLAAPAVISWMDQKLPQRVKFLVHGHQKLLKLEDFKRKSFFYPTSRTMDVQLLNRMLNGDFEAAQADKASNPTTKTVVIRQNKLTLLPTPPSSLCVTDDPVPNTTQLESLKGRMYGKSQPKAVVVENHCGPAKGMQNTVLESPTKFRKYSPVIPPGKPQRREEIQQRKRISWN